MSSPDDFRQLDPRRAISDRIDRRRIALELKRASRPAIIVALGVALGVALTVYTAVNLSRTALRGTRTVQFTVPDATGVVPGQDEVRFRGIPAGTLSAVALEHGRAVVTVKLRNEFGPIYRNARVEIRPQTPLQDMYLDVIDRGTRAAGVADPAQPLPMTQARSPVNINDVLNTFDGDVRRNLRALLANLGNGLSDRGASLRTAFVQLVPLMRTAGRIGDQLSARAPKLRRLVHNTAALADTLAHHQRELRTLITDGSATLTALQQNAGNLDATIHELPRTLDAVDTSFAALRGVLPATDKAVARLMPVANHLDGALTDLRNLNKVAAPAVRALQRPVTRLVPLSTALAPLSTNLRTTVDILRPQTDTVAKVARDLADCRKGIQGFFQWDASMMKFGDARGVVPRGNLVIGATSSSVLTNGFEFRNKTCTPGGPIPGRPAEAKDFR
ncbi:MAG: Mammalian cell entry related domain protein [Solirubrobacterales bacterium]|nr:Mammalian cell entry related domain protein [Solirubrobacterales bacterium]